MRLASLLFLASLFASCAPKAVVIPPMVRITAPEKAPDVAPALRDARKAAADADKKGDQARASVASVSREATGLREGLQAAVVEADRLRKQKTASEAELDGMWRSLEALTARNLFLEAEAAKAADALEHEKALRRGAADAMIYAEQLALQKQTEANQLRLQLIDSEAARAASHQASEAMAKAVAAANERADKQAGELRLWRWGGLILGLLMAAWVVIKAVTR